MKNKSIINVAFLIALIIFAYLLFVYIPNKIEENNNSGVEVGEIWMWQKKEANPFEKEEIQCYKVLDVKKGYVKYLLLPQGHISSIEIRYFKFQSKKIKDGKH